MELDPKLGARLARVLASIWSHGSTGYTCAMPGPDWLCYTDGACKPGVIGAPGGWGFVVRPPSGAGIEGYGRATGTQAKIMEYRAVAEALAVLPAGVSAVVYSDNQPLVESIGRDLARSPSKVDPLVRDWLLAIRAQIATKQLSVRWQWVRAHNGNAGNERADALAARGAREAKVEIAERGR